MIDFLVRFSGFFVKGTVILSTGAILIGGFLLWVFYKRSRVEFDFAGKTSEGGRDQNQDLLGGKGDGLPQALIGNKWSFRKKSGKFCFVIADGLGGHSGGEKAAELAVKSVLEHFDNSKKINKENIYQELQQAIINAHQRIGEEARANPLLEDMKATCVALFLLGNRAYWSNIGDSRLYLFRKGKILHKTKDHSVVQILLDMHEIEEHDVRSHPDRNRVLKSLGMNDDIKPEIFFETLKKGDYLLLCTDGLWEYFLDEELETAVAAFSLSIEHELDKLFLMANTRALASDKPHDNLTLLLIGVR